VILISKSKNKKKMMSRKIPTSNNITLVSGMKTCSMATSEFHHPTIASRLATKEERLLQDCSLAQLSRDKDLITLRNKKLLSSNP
jgi:hypothetical protein